MLGAWRAQASSGAEALTLAACIIGSSLAFIDATVVIVALPTIEADLDLGLAGQEWVFLSYSLALASLYLVAGSIGDRVGRRTAFVAGVAGFAVASAIAGLAPNGDGADRGARAPGRRGRVPHDELARAAPRASTATRPAGRSACWTAFTSVATIGGPPVGGAIVEWTSWRWIFYLNLPLAVATVAARAPRPLRREALREHAGGSTSPARSSPRVGFGLLTYGMVEGADKGFADSGGRSPSPASRSSRSPIVERRVAEPMLPFALFRQGNLAAANAETFLVYAALYGFLVYFTLYLQTIGFTPFEAGLITTPTSLVLILLAARFGALADTHGPRLFLTVGPALIGAGVLLSMLIDEQSDFWTAGIASLARLLASASRCIVAPITATALKSAPTELAGIASGVNSTVSRLGSLTAVAIDRARRLARRSTGRRTPPTPSR